MTLSLCMIVKNEADVLSRALERASVFADEIVVTDTGSTDGTKGIAAAMGARVVDFEWVHDFSAARNYCISQASGDYYMWLDADDVVPEATAADIAKLKSTLDPAVDVVMLPYVLSRDERGKAQFSYYRERIIRRRSDFLFAGRVHEAVPLHGNIVNLPFEIEHRKPPGRGNGSRNLDIYNRMKAEGVEFCPREIYYYARELYYHDEFARAADEFVEFLRRGSSYAPNNIDACIMLARCLKSLEKKSDAVGALCHSFAYGLPTGEACCELGHIYFEEEDYRTAAYWFDRAAHSKPDFNSGAFIDKDCYGFLPYVWLTVCYDRLGERRAALYCHCRAKRIKPSHASVLANDEYFKSLGLL